MSWAPRFPTWFKPAWGPQWFSFGGSVDNKPIPIVASGWTDRYNGTRLTPNSSAATIVFSTAYERSAWDLGVESLGPGTARLTIAPATTGDSTDQALTMWGCVDDLTLHPTDLSPVALLSVPCVAALGARLAWLSPAPVLTSIGACCQRLQACPVRPVRPQRQPDR